MILDLPQGSYLAFLAFSILGLLGLDHRFKLAFFLDPIRSLISTVPVLLMFVIWDFLGIQLGIFFRGDNNLLTGIVLAPEFPLEEIFFLVLLSYTTLLIFLSVARLLDRSTKK